MLKATIVERFLHRSAIYPNEEAYWVREEAGWKKHTWSQYCDQVKQFTKGLVAIGFQEREHVAILSFTRPEWIIACVAAQMGNGVSVGIYTNSSAEEVKHVLSHSESAILVVENWDRYSKQIQQSRLDLPHLRAVILMEGQADAEEPWIYTWKEVLQKGKQVSDMELEQRIQCIDAQQVASIIYTSGTTGAPKGVMLSHKNIYWTAQTTIQMVHVGRGDSMLSYLPLAHVAEQMFSVYAPIMSGLSLYFAKSIDRVLEHLKEVEPTIFFGVPRVYEKIHDRINTQIQQASWQKQWILRWVQQIAVEYWEDHHRGLPASLWLKIRYAICDWLVFGQIRKRMGFSRTRLCVVGAAPIDKQILYFFQSLGMPVYEVYGQSENTGPATINLPGRANMGSAGKPLKGVQIQVLEDGEVCIRGPNVFLGYLKDAQATAEVLMDGWLRTGDVGMIDQDGFLSITDRKKDLLITSGGKNVSPQNIEMMLKKIPFVRSAVVLGDRKKYLTALLTPNQEYVEHFAGKMGIEYVDFRDLLSDQKLHEKIESEIHKINQKLAPVEQIKKFKILPRDFSVETGELTPTMKLRRKFISACYQREIEQLYG